MKCFYTRTERESLYSSLVENSGSCLVVVHGMGYENVKFKNIFCEELLIQCELGGSWPCCHW